MIEAKAYYVVYYVKKVQVFVISLKNFQYQAEKEVKIVTDLKSIILKKYHDFLNIFLKENLNTFLTY